MLNFGICLYKVTCLLNTIFICVQFLAINFVMEDICILSTSCRCTSSRDRVGGNQSVREHTTLWDGNNTGLSWPGDGRYGSSCVRSGRGGLQKNVSVIELFNASCNGFMLYHEAIALVIIALM